MPRKKLNPSQGWPHKCGSTRTWVKTSDTQLRIVCSFCRKLIGVWNFTSAKKEKVVSDFTEDQKNKWK